MRKMACRTTRNVSSLCLRASKTSISANCTPHVVWLMSHQVHIHTVECQSLAVQSDNVLAICCDHRPLMSLSWAYSHSICSTQHAPNHGSNVH